MNSLSTHVLDTMHGHPATGMAIALIDAGGATLFRGATDGDGRCPGLPRLEAGRYRLEFAVAPYFAGLGVTLPDPPFLDIVGVDFGIAGTGHYHVPLLVSPFAYSTYRGS